MRKFILYACLFTIPIIVFAFFIDRFLTANLKRVNSGETKVVNDIFNGRINSKLVIYGSSRASEQINPKIFEDSFGISSYNIGGKGDNFKFQYLRHTLLLKYGMKPNVIIHELDVQTLYKKDTINTDEYLPYMTTDPSIIAALSSLPGFSWFDFSIPSVRYYGKKEKINSAFSVALTSDNINNNTKGYDPKNLKWHASGGKIDSRILDTSQVKLFDRYLKECKNNGIKIIFVYPPYHRSAFILYTVNFDNMLSLFNSISRKYNIPFYNYANDTMGLNTGYFYNPTHLNALGSDIFTKKFISDLRKNNELRID